MAGRGGWGGPRSHNNTHLVSIRIATENGNPTGWFVDGKIPLEPKEKREIAAPRVGWLFSQRLHARLRQLQR
jgi:hypothetical protein